MELGGADTETSTAMEHGVIVARLTAMEHGVIVARLTAMERGVVVARLAAMEHGVAVTDRQATKFGSAEQSSGLNPWIEIVSTQGFIPVGPELHARLALKACTT